MYTVIDRDNGERFVTVDYESLQKAIRRRNELALEYGKQFCLGIGEIDNQGNVKDITEDITEDLQN